jgi:hypothetical protein
MPSMDYGPESLAQGLQSTGHHEAQRKLQHDLALLLCLFLVTFLSSTRPTPNDNITNCPMLIQTSKEKHFQSPPSGKIVMYKRRAAQVLSRAVWLRSPHAGTFGDGRDALKLTCRIADDTCTRSPPPAPNFTKLFAHHIITTVVD